VVDVLLVRDYLLLPCFVVPLSDLMLSLLCDVYRSVPLAASLLLLHRHHHHLFLMLLLAVTVTCGQRRVLAAANLVLPLLELLAAALYLPVLVGAER
jgi:hypothetical protein